MKFDTDFRRKIAKSLLFHKDVLIDGINSLISSCGDNCRMGVLLNWGDTDLYKIKNDINLLLKNDGNPLFINNEIIFESIPYRPKLTNIHDSAIKDFDVFYSESNNQLLFSQLPTNKIIEDNRTQKSILDIVNKKNYIDLILSIINILYSDEFNYSKQVSNKNIRYLYPLSNGCSIGFEFNKKHFEQVLNNGFSEPELKIIMINNTFDRSIKESEYLYNKNNSILFLSNFRNPYFPYATSEIKSIFSFKLFEGSYMNVEKILNSDNDLFFRKYTFYYFCKHKMYLHSFLNYLKVATLKVTTGDFDNFNLSYSKVELEYMKKNYQDVKKVVEEISENLEKSKNNKLISNSMYNEQLLLINQRCEELKDCARILKENNMLD